MMAVSHFQLAHLLFMHGHEYRKAAVKYEETLKCMRENAVVEYGQIGLEFTLYECEVWFNHGLCHARLGNTAVALQSFMHGHLAKRLMRHDIIEEAISHSGRDLMPFAPPDLKVYRPKRIPALNGSSMLGALSVTGGLHTPVPSSLFSETQSRKVVAVTEGELRPEVYDFGTHHIKAALSRVTFGSETTEQSSNLAMSLIKLVLDNQNEIRYTRLDPSLSAKDLLQKIGIKLNDDKIRVKYSDCHGDWICLIDDDDLALALEASFNQRYLTLHCLY
jgi:hypothetical protein